MPVGAWFGTAYDVPSAQLEVPADVTGGDQPGVGIVDQVVRGKAIVGRVTGDFGAVALKIRGTGEPVRVTVLIHLDEVATRWWSDRVRPTPGEPERPRLVLLRAQGRTRGAVVLARRQGWLRAGGAKATVEFDLTADELDHDGLLVVELAEPTLPTWAARGLAARGALGLRIDRITVRPQPSTTAATDSHRATGCLFLVLGPGDPARFRLAIEPVPPAPPVPHSPKNRWTRRKPARAAFKALRIARRAAGRAAVEVSRGSRGDTAGAQAADLVTGEPVGVEIVARDAGGLELRLSGTVANPVVLGVTGIAPHTSLRVAP